MIRQIGSIIAGMERIRRYYDDFAARWFSLNGAILYLLFYAFFCFRGFFELVVVRRGYGADRSFSWIFLFLGLFGMLHARK